MNIAKLIIILMLIIAVIMTESGALGRHILLNNSWHGLKPGTATAYDIEFAMGGLPDFKADNVKYGTCTDLHMMSYGDSVVSFFLREDRLLLIVLKPRPGGEFPTRLSNWEMNQSAPVLPSVAGKNQRIHVYSEIGLTATAEGDTVSLVEIFAPMVPNEYVRTIYKSPEAFRR